MQLAKVLGEVVATIKDANLTGLKLLVLQPVTPAGDPAGRTLVAVDSVGAGVGENVFFVRGREASFPFHPAEPPADAAVIGIVDRRDTEQRQEDGKLGAGSWELKGRARESSEPSSRRRRTGSSKGPSCCSCSR